MKIISLKIMGVRWTAKVFSAEKFYNIHPECEDSLALTLPCKKELHFIDEYIDLGIVRHEVRHAFISELCLCSTDLENYQFEEIQCTLDQNRWDEMNEASIRIYEGLIFS